MEVHGIFISILPPMSLTELFSSKNSFNVVVIEIDMGDSHSPCQDAYGPYDSPPPTVIDKSQILPL